MKEVKTEVSAASGGAKDTIFWTPAREGVLRKGFSDEPNAKSKAIDRMRALHPKLKKLNTIQKRMDGIAPNGLAVWMTPDFWRKEIDLTLIEGIYGGKAKQPEAIERIRSVWPELDSEGLSERMEMLAWESQPAWFRKTFWQDSDPILIAGMKQGKIGERQAVAQVLRLHPELRVERAWARIRELHHRNGKASSRAGPFLWTAEQEQRLLALHLEVGLKGAVSILERETGWPRDSIIRKAHKLGVPKKVYRGKQEWSEADRTLLLVSVRHVPVRKIARLLGRPEKAVWVQIWREGLPGAWEEGYSRRELCRKFHVSLPTLRGWIRAEWLKDGAQGRVPERSVRAFLRQHSDLVVWNRLDPEARQWALELSGTEDGANGDGRGGDQIKASFANRLAAATGQT